MAVRFLAGPAVMAVASVAVGLRGTLLRIAIVQVRTYVSPAGQSVPNLVSRFYVTCCYVLRRRLCHRGSCRSCSPRSTISMPPFFAPGN
jgi:hypothetical protein